MATDLLLNTRALIARSPFRSELTAFASWLIAEHYTPLAVHRHLTRAHETADRPTPPGERLSEHGIEYECLPDTDGVFRVNVMVGGRRVYRTLGRTSDGLTPRKAWEWTSELRVQAAQERLGLAKGRKTHMMFNEAASRPEGKDPTSVPAPHLFLWAVAAVKYRQSQCRTIQKETTR